MFACTKPSCGELPGPLLFRRLCFLSSRAAERTGEAVIPLVACIFEKLAFALRYRNFYRPGAVPCFLVFHGELINERVGISAPESLGELHVRAASVERIFI